MQRPDHPLTAPLLQLQNAASGRPLYKYNDTAAISRCVTSPRIIVPPLGTCAAAGWVGQRHGRVRECRSQGCHDKASPGVVPLKCTCYAVQLTWREERNADRELSLFV